MSADGWHYAGAVDTETTGIGRDARVVQVAALRMRWRWPDATSVVPDVEFSDTYRLVSLVKPPTGTWFDPNAVRVTGIGPAQVAMAPSFTDVLPELRRVVCKLPVIAHNSPFDRRMLDREMQHTGDTTFDVAWICSMQAVRRTGLFASARLGDVARTLGIEPRGGLHDAGVDAELAGRVYAHVSRHAHHGVVSPARYAHQGMARGMKS